MGGIALASDHAGFALKDALASHLRAARREVMDLGSFDPALREAYPDFLLLACEAVRRGAAERAIFICEDPVGAAMAANKFPGVRAGVARDAAAAGRSVERDDMNVLCLAPDGIGDDAARRVAETFASARFQPGGEQIRLLRMVHALESRYLRTG
jgi:RpiB/LacA/LacB family sugar-phosphate isomerase